MQLNYSFVLYILFYSVSVFLGICCSATKKQYDLANYLMGLGFSVWSIKQIVIVLPHRVVVEVK